MLPGLALLGCLLSQAAWAQPQVNVQPPAPPAQPEPCVALPAAEAQQVRAIRVTSAIPQDMVTTMIPTVVHTTVVRGAGYTGSMAGPIFGGLLADVIVNSETLDRMRRTTLALPQLVAASHELDVRRQFWLRLEQSLEEHSRFRVLDVRRFDSERPYVEDLYSIRGEPVDAVLELSTGYAFTMDLRMFVMETEVLLHARPDGRELYRCQYRFVTPPVDEGDLETAIAAWSANDAALYRAAALLGVEQTLKMLRHDLVGRQAPSPSGEQVEYTDVMPPAPGGLTLRAELTGSLVEADAGTLIVRGELGRMRSLWMGDLFRPDNDVLKLALPGNASRRAGPVLLDELLGLLELDRAAPLPPGRRARPVAWEDLEGLLGE
jgi:hypothetical protein